MENGTVHRATLFIDAVTFATINNIDADTIADTLTTGVMDLIIEVLLSGNDKLTGTNGDSYVEGYAGNDRLFGLNGQDILVGGIGKDELSGGKDSDVFVFFDGDGKDVVTDYDFTGGYSKRKLRALRVYVVIGCLLVADGPCNEVASPANFLRL